ncbi:unnamed protein product [Rotaria sordida]|uniref:HAT C-terminal dimerisation domain-containing protein n=1 Tax=Rotaria sordida TaxID=392033 RepID=A0A819JYU2_9BILA|nr:unnamed protein product [Rotaria sordida]
MQIDSSNITTIDLTLPTADAQTSSSNDDKTLKVLCVPATSAPVERVFSQSGLLIRPHRSRLSKDMLSKLTFVKCNLALLN